MKLTTTLATRPSPLAAVGQTAQRGCTAPTALFAAVGQPAVETAVRWWRSSDFHGAGSKINSMGMATTLAAAGTVSADIDRGYRIGVQLGAAKGVKVADARGVPPRGRPV